VGALLTGCQKSLVGLFWQPENAVTFPQLRSVKVLAARAARLAKQGFAGHSISFEAGLAPSSSPRRCAVFTSEESFSTRIRAGPLQRGPALMHFSAWSGRWTGGENSEIPANVKKKIDNSGKCNTLKVVRRGDQKVQEHRSV